MNVGNDDTVNAMISVIREASTVNDVRIVLKLVKTMSHFHAHEVEAIRKALATKLEELKEETTELFKEICRVLNEDKIVP